MNLHYLSAVTTPIAVINALGTFLSRATGFFYRSPNNDPYLITNWHVATGRDPRNPVVSSRGAIPTTFKLAFLRSIVKDDKKLINITSPIFIEIEINNDEGTSPKWLEHPEYGYNVDVIAIEISQYVDIPSILLSFMNEFPSNHESYRPQVMDSAFVVGYPYGLSGGHPALPLFKRGNICSEPEIKYNGLPRFLIDCRTSPSMSGAPVLASHSGVWDPDGTFGPKAFIGTVEKFIGVYSGRLHELPEYMSEPSSEIIPSEIGIVWQENVIKEIIEGQKRGSTIADML